MAVCPPKRTTTPYGRSVSITFSHVFRRQRLEIQPSAVSKSVETVIGVLC